MKEAKWIFNNKIEPKNKSVILFRKKFYVEDSVLPISEAKITITAETRYRLYINGRYVCRGPLRGDQYRKYYDEIDISNWIISGNNVICIQIVHISPGDDYLHPFQNGPTALIGNKIHGLLIYSYNANIDVSTDSQYKTDEDLSLCFEDSEFTRYAGDVERYCTNKQQLNWLQYEFDDNGFIEAEELYTEDLKTMANSYGVLKTWQLTKRSIPMMYEKNILPVRCLNQSEEINFSPLLSGGQVVIPSNTDAFVELDMGNLVTAYVNTEIDKTSAGNSIEYLYSEAYYQNIGGEIVKKVRDVHQTGFLQGDKDQLITSDLPQSYEPYFMRTFRFMRIHIKTLNECMIIKSLSFRLTGYPLNIIGEFRAEDERLNRVWEISERTLLRCMHETYIDCPYYEQLQYVLDTMIQASLTYCVSSDGRLAKKAILDFMSSQMPNGLIKCKSPSQDRHIIPGFALYYIDMIYRYCNYFSDIETLKYYIPVMERILNYFRSCRDKTWIIKNGQYWQFIDWTIEWKHTHGQIPVNESNGYNYIYTLMYAYTLKIMKKCYLMVGWQEQNKRIEKEYNYTKDAVNEIIWDEHEKFYKSAEFSRQYSQHAQIWAVLSECIEGEEAKWLLKKTFTDDKMIQCSYPMIFYCFDALKMTASYQLSKCLWEKWFSLLHLNLTTWIEEPVSQRSDCHGWSAVPLYGITTHLLGVTVEKDVVTINPQMFEFGSMCGRVALSDGFIDVTRKVEAKESDIIVTIKVITNMKRKLKIIINGDICDDVYSDSVIVEHKVYLNN